MRKLALFSAAFSAAACVWAYGWWPLLPLVLLPGLRKRPGRGLCCALLCAGALAGLLWCACYDQIFRAPARELEGRTAVLEATVEDWPWASRYGGAATIRVRPEAGPSFLARLYGGEELLALRPGDGLRCTADCRSPDRVAGEESGSYTSNGIFLLAYARGEPEVSRPDRPPVWAWPAWWARALKESVAGTLSPEAAPLATALLTGDERGLADGDYAALQRTGLAHTAAVSGLHIGFLASLIVGLSGRHRRRTAALALPVLAVYVLVSGSPPSAVRAAVMQGILLLGPLLRREPDPPTSLASALLVLVVQCPYCVQDIGLQLSFASVAGIFLFAGPVYRRLWGPFQGRQKDPLRRLLQRPARALCASLSVSAGAAAATTPLSAGYFGSVALVTPLANLLCLPLVSLLFLASLGTALLGLAWPAGGRAAGGVVSLLAELLWALVRGLEGLPFASVALQGRYLPLWLGFCYLVWLLFLWKRGHRPLVPLCACVIALCWSLVLTRLTYDIGPMTVTVLDVGQGQCVVVRAGERTAVVDCGGSGLRNAGDRAADYLSTLGVERVDLLILTHCHSDHANGAAELLERMAVDVLALPGAEEEVPLREELMALAEEKGTMVWSIHDDVSLPFGAAELTLYAPLGAGEQNEAGLSVLWEAGTFAALLTGDMGGDIEARLVKYGDLPQVDLLVAGHHGGAGSTSQLLLDTVEPETAAVSVGYNSYGHPAPEVLLRLHRAGCGVYRTDLQGDITITVG